MKTFLILLSVLLLLGIEATSKPVASGESNTFLDSYKLVQTADNVFELSYANTAEKFTIEVCPVADECCYLVRGKKVEVMYQCNALGFGLRKMPEAQQSRPTSDYGQLLNCKTFMYHSCITQKQPGVKKALKLIACFFPEVIHEEARIQVFQPIKSNTENKLALIN
jgi:hypothetical protein